MKLFAIKNVETNEFIARGRWSGNTQDFLQARMYGRRCDASRRANELNHYAKREAYTLVQIEARFKVDGDVKPGSRKS